MKKFVGLLTKKKEKQLMNKWENNDSDKFQALYSGYNQQEVAPLKNIFFLAVLKLDMKDSFGCN